MAAVDIDNFIDPRILEEVSKLSQQMIELNSIINESIKITAEYKRLTARSSTDAEAEKNYKLVGSAMEDLNKKLTERIQVEKQATDILDRANKGLKDYQNEVNRISATIQKGETDISRLVGRITELNRKFDENKERIRANKTALDVLSNTIQGNTQLTERNKEAYQSAQKALADSYEERARLNTQISQGNIQLRSLIKENDSANGSMDQMAQELGRLRSYFRGLSEEMRNNTEISGPILERIQMLDKDLKVLDGTLGNHQRNVGDYAGQVVKVRTQLMNITEDIVKQTLSLDELNTKIAEQTARTQALIREKGAESAEYKEARQELDNLTQAQQTAAKTMAELQEQGGKLRDAYSDAQTSIKNLASDTASLDALNQGIGTLAAGYTVYVSTMKAVGIENESMIEIFARLQVVQQAVNALQVITNNLQQESTLRLKLKATWEKISAAFTEARFKATIQETAAETANTAATRTNTAATAAQATATTTATAASTGFSVSLRAVGAAIKAIPGVGWLLAIVSGLIAAGAVITRLVNSTKELTGEMRMQLELENDRATIRSKVIDQTVEENNYLRIQLDIINSVNQGTAEWYNALGNIENIIGKLNDGQKANAQTISESVDQYQNLNKSITTANAALQQANENEQRGNEQVLAMQQRINEAMFRKVKLSKEDENNLQNILGYQSWQVDLTQRSLNYLTSNGKRYREITEKQQQGVTLTKEELELLRNVEGRIRVINEFLNRGTGLIAKNNDKLLEGIEEQIAANDKLQKQREASIGLDDNLRTSNAKAQDAINRNNTASLRERARQIREHYDKEIFPLYDKDSQEYKKHLQIMNNDLADINRQIVENNRKTQDSIFQMRLRYFDTIAETEIDKMRLQILRLQDQNKKIAQQYGERSKIAIASEEYTQAAIDKLTRDFLNKRNDQIVTASLDLRDELLKGGEAQYQELERLGSNFLDIGISNEDSRLRLQEERMRQQFLNERELLDKEIEIYGESYEAYKEMNGEKVLSESEWVKYREQAINLISLKEQEFLTQIENATEVSERKKQEIRQKYLDAQLAMVAQRYDTEANRLIIDAGSSLTTKQQQQLDDELAQLRISNIDAQIAKMEEQRTMQSELLGSTQEYYESLGITEEQWTAKYLELQAQRTTAERENAEERIRIQLQEMEQMNSFVNAVFDSYFQIGEALLEGVQNERDRSIAMKQLALAQIAVQQGLATAYAITAALQPGGNWITAAIQIASAIGTITAHFIKLKNEINAARIYNGNDAIQKYAEGTLNHPGGPALTGEAGPEIINTPGIKPFIVDKPTIFPNMKKGTQVIPFDKIPEYTSSYSNNPDLTELYQRIDATNDKLDTLCRKPTVQVNASENLYYHIVKGSGKSRLLNSSFNY